MTNDSYLDRIKKARQITQERLVAELPRAKLLLEKTAETTSALTTKAAASVAEGCASAVEKAKQSLESEEIQQVGRCLREAGTTSQKAIIEARQKAQALLRGTVFSEAKPDADAPDEAAIKQAIEKMHGRDRLGLAGEHLAAAGGAAAGVAAAGSIASAAGATTLLGSTTLASMLGGVFVTTTPVGWVIGSAAVMGAAGYGIAKLVRSGSEQDRLRKAFIERQTQRLMDLETVRAPLDEKVELSQLIALTLAAGVLEQDAARRMVDLVNAGKLPTSLALERVRAIALATELIEQKG
ncbi:TPA: hypothetical protein NIJ95_003768 [Pseudomonas aeruginosa]|uniref:hypothetical protein n=1 Tax=Pseudomonas aeruginosa TaxID=287 RepID=UPI000F8433A5|nr:hypothetical protein [Pseudomonas aeruginosa]MBG6310082.1 hypothetical protein [Pseudomonas aeruginosa]MDP5646568.1 hypothetical protein [Pseudomonas aeruginosa]RTW51817.1 hypothetical protein DZA06_16450 [Pseudomonas aeruginosa]HCF7393616.1 hypothetical protein [Pseudomonas aeruginosa]HCF7399556.1 hypothetical protein [Pseudomonas aeruginosa]